MSNFVDVGLLERVMNVFLHKQDFSFFSCWKIPLVVAPLGSAGGWRSMFFLFFLQSWTKTCRKYVRACFDTSIKANYNFYVENRNKNKRCGYIDPTPLPVKNDF